MAWTGTSGPMVCEIFSLAPAEDVSIVIYLGSPQRFECMSTSSQVACETNTTREVAVGLPDAVLRLPECLEIGQSREGFHLEEGGSVWTWMMVVNYRIRTQ